MFILSQLHACYRIVNINRLIFYYLLCAVEGSDRRYSKGLLQRVDTDVGEGGGAPRNRLVSIVDENLHKTERENSLKGLSHAPGVGAVDSYGKYLRFLFPRNLVREFRQSVEITGKDGHRVAFVGELPGDGAAQIRSDADNGSDTPAGTGAWNVAHHSSAPSAWTPGSLA